MSLWNKILLGLIFVASLAFFYMAARTLKCHQYWRDLARKFEQKIEAVSAENTQLLEAEKLESGRLGNNRARAELEKVLIQRGRVWFNCDPLKPDERGRVAVNTDLPVPNGISDKMILYVFEEVDAQKGGGYIGEFRVTGVAEKKIALEPIMRMTERELKRLNRSKGPWTLYELMPIDRHELFVDMPDDEKKALLPPESLAEYVKDGQPADANDPEDCKENGKYVRRLRDYREQFKVYHTERTLFVDLYESVIRDLKYALDAKADADQQLAFSQRRKAALEKELAWAQKERDYVTRYRGILETKVKAIQQIVAEKIQENLKLAGEIAKLQLEAARRIDERMRNVVQAPTRVN